MKLVAKVAGARTGIHDQSLMNTFGPQDIRLESQICIFPFSCLASLSCGLWLRIHLHRQVEEDGWLPQWETGLLEPATYARCTEFESYEDVAMSMDAGQSLELTKERSKRIILKNFHHVSLCHDVLPYFESVRETWISLSDALSRHSARLCSIQYPRFAPVISLCMAPSSIHWDSYQIKSARGNVALCWYDAGIINEQCTPNTHEVAQKTVIIIIHKSMYRIILQIRVRSVCSCG